MKKSITRIVCFVIILCMVLVGVNKILKVKYSDGIYNVTKLYELENNTVDVLFLGSSHAFEDFNTGVLWDEYGIASYIFAGSVQPMWNTYYYLKEALKTQHPELIVLEGYMVTWSQEYSDNIDYSDDSRIIKNNFGLKWSVDKLNSLMVSAPKERWPEFILEYVQYHTRYRELSAADFLPNQNYRLYDDWKGFGCNMETSPEESIDVSGVIGKEPLHEKTEKYYRMILELAQSNDIPIVVAISPYARINEYEQMQYNTAEDIANEYGIPFVNFNLLKDEIGLDYSTDAADSAHLNYKGNQKFSEYCGAYLKSNYDISDRRGDTQYASWDRMSLYVKQMIYNQQLIETTNHNEIPDLLKNDKYWVFVSVDGNCNPLKNETIHTFLQSLSIDDEEMLGIWLIQNEHSIVWKSGLSTEEQYITTARHDFYMRRNVDGSNTVLIDNFTYKKVDNGINVVVYDNLSEKVADCFGIDADDSSIIR